jgi:hypothetical protein
MEERVETETSYLQDSNRIASSRRSRPTQNIELSMESPSRLGGQNSNNSTPD